MARARILQAAIQNERAEEQVGESPPTLPCTPILPAAMQKRQSALAKLTQNNRLLAGRLCRHASSIAANDFFQDWDDGKALSLHTRQREMVGKDDLDHLSKQLSLLKTRILRATGIDEMLRSWSEGIVGDKTFQQVTEEFAELVIPKVWAREGRKIARVAEQLSISPKKVRRILNNVNLLRPQ